MIRAILAIRRSEPLKAVEVLEPAAPYESGVPRCALTGFFGSLYPILVRGEAYLAARKGPRSCARISKAAQSSGDHDRRSGFSARPLWPGARLFLSGDATNAREQYREFLADWKDADPDIPILQQAKLEYRELQ